MLLHLKNTATTAAAARRAAAPPIDDPEERRLLSATTSTTNTADLVGSTSLLFYKKHQTVITNLLAGYGTHISNTYKVDLSEPNGATREGDEVLSDAWMAADATQPVVVRQLAGFHTEGNVVHTYWFTGDATSQASHQLF